MVVATDAMWPGRNAYTDHGNGVGDTRDGGACYHADGGDIVRQ